MYDWAWLHDSASSSPFYLRVKIGPVHAVRHRTDEVVREVEPRTSCSLRIYITPSGPDDLNSSSCGYELSGGTAIAAPPPTWGETAIAASPPCALCSAVLVSHTLHEWAGSDAGLEPRL